MSIAKSVHIPNSYQFGFIHIDNYENKCMIGRIYHPSFERSKDFQSLIDLLQIMEELFDNTSYPIANMNIRKFWPAKVNETGEDNNFYGDKKDNSIYYLEKKGKLASFTVRVQFRRNASWQGTIRWIDKNKIECFRSTLEMIMLMDSALSNAEGWDKEKKEIVFNF